MICRRCGDAEPSIAAILVVPAGGETRWALCRHCLLEMPWPTNTVRDCGQIPTFCNIPQRSITIAPPRFARKSAQELLTLKTNF
jgi:hypothetical protein